MDRIHQTMRFKSTTGREMAFATYFRKCFQCGSWRHDCGHREEQLVEWFLALTEDERERKIREEQ